MDPKDLEKLRKEALEQSPFDPLLLRKRMWDQVENGTATVVCKACSLAKVVYIQDHRKKIEPPWDLWSRIFQWLGVTPERWSVYWFPSPIKRVLPLPGEPVGPSHVNGGYTFPCSKNAIVVYRLEEATRVLLHELLHGACLDPKGAIEWREATIETWAELYLIALCAEQSHAKLNELWSIQSQWIADQNHQLRSKYSVLVPDHYAWRYTLGRESILLNMRIELPEPNTKKSMSSRLTSPLLSP